MSRFKIYLTGTLNIVDPLHKFAVEDYDIHTAVLSLFHGFKEGHYQRPQRPNWPPFPPLPSLSPLTSLSMYRLSYTVKKAFRYSRPHPGCHLPNSPWAGIMTSFQIQIIPAQKEFGKFDGMVNVE